MHEFSVAQSIVSTILEVAHSHGAKRIVGVQLEVGEVALVNMQQLGWYLDMLTQDTMAKGMKVNVISVPVRVHCQGCGYEGPLKEGSGGDSDDPTHSSIPGFDCPRCGGSDTVITSGRDLRIKDIEVEYEGD